MCMEMLKYQGLLKSCMEAVQDALHKYVHQSIYQSVDLSLYVSLFVDPPLFCACVYVCVRHIKSFKTKFPSASREIER